MNNFIDRVEQGILRGTLLEEGEAILLAVSGGLDSMVMLEVLRRLAPRHGWRLIVAHFNHRLRGAAGAADEKFVRAHASKIGLEYGSGAASVRARSRSDRVSLEMAGRAARHAFLAEAARRHGASKICLAHHADDQLELFLMRVLRGASGEGLSGMTPGSVSPANPDVRLVRPLLRFSRAEIESFARGKRIACRTDTSNLDCGILRNRVRHRLIPLILREFNPSLAATVQTTMRLLGDEADLAKVTATAWLDSGRPETFESLHVAVQRQIVKLKLIELGVAPSFQRIEALRERVGKPMSLAPGVVVTLNSKGDLIRKRAFNEGFGTRKAVFHPGVQSKRIQFRGVSIRARVISSRLWNLRRKRGESRGSVEYFDWDQIGRKVLLRNWRAGDRFRPKGLGGSVKLQDLFTNARVRREDRHARILATTSDNVIFWVEGFRIGEHFKVTATTRRVLEWRWRSTQRAVTSAQGRRPVPT